LIETTSKAASLLWAAGVEEFPGTLEAIPVWATTKLADNDKATPIKNLRIIR
jgi:hypothetical protein